MSRAAASIGAATGDFRPAPRPPAQTASGARGPWRAWSSNLGTSTSWSLPSPRKSRADRQSASRTASPAAICRIASSARPLSRNRHCVERRPSVASEQGSQCRDPRVTRVVVTVQDRDPCTVPQPACRVHGERAELAWQTGGEVEHLRLRRGALGADGDQQPPRSTSAATSRAASALSPTRAARMVWSNGPCDGSGAAALSMNANAMRRPNTPPARFTSSL